MNVRAVAALVTILALSGCATHKYEWNDYDTKLFRFYKDPATANDFKSSLQTHLETLETKNTVPPPGLYAELGTLNLEHGDDKTALVYYRKERDAWRESRFLMDTMIKTLETRAKRMAPK